MTRFSPEAPINKIIPLSVVDGPGCRTSVFVQGCNIACAYCHSSYAAPAESAPGSARPERFLWKREAGSHQKSGLYGMRNCVSSVTTVFVSVPISLPRRYAG